MKRFILSLLILAVLPLSGAAQPREPLQSRISRDSILIGDQIEWTLDFSIAPGEAARVSKPGPAPVPGVEALGEMALDTLSIEKGTQHLRGHITLTSFDSGSYVLPPLYVLLARADGSVDTLEYAGPTLAVNTIPVDTATFQLYDIKGQIRYPLTFKEVIPWSDLPYWSRPWSGSWYAGSGTDARTVISSASRWSRIPRILSPCAALRKPVPRNCGRTVNRSSSTRR